MTGSRARLAPVMSIVVSLAFVGACGGSKTTGASSTGTTATAASTPTAPTTADPGQPRAAARWETVVSLDGGAGTTTTAPFAVLASAIQWRARWSCESGTLRVETDPPPRRPGALIDSPCPKNGDAFSIVTGTVNLTVNATGAWKMTIDQQVDTPLNEPPLPAMATAKVVSQGDFYNVEKNGKGNAKIYQLPDGTPALRIESLEVNQNTDLFVWLDAAVSPKTSKDAVSSEYWVLANLKSTIGDQNYVIPANIPVSRVRSVIIWCQPVAIAYAAAALG